MSYIDLELVQAVRNRLLEQISVLETIRDELEYTEQKIKNAVYIEQMIHDLRKNRQEIEAEIQGFRKMAECLDEVIRITRNTEQKITEMYDLDVTVFPETTFQLSRILIEKECESLFRFIGS